MTKSKLFRFFSWIKDHLYLLIEVIVKLRVGDEKKQLTKNSSTEETGERMSVNDTEST